VVAPSRRSPWPVDIRIAGTGLMLGRSAKSSPLIAVDAQPYSEQPTPGDNAQEQAPQLVELAHAYSDLSMGFGMKIQGDLQQDHKTRVCLGADTSTGGLIMKGPAVTKFTPGTTDSTNGATKFIESGGTLSVSMGRYWLKYVNDSSWTVSKDFGAGLFTIDAEVFQSGGGSPATPVLFACMNSTNKAQYSSDAGATWTQMATHVNLAMATVGRELYRASSVNQLSKVDANSDPTVEANWTNANSFNAGDKTYPINRLCVNAVGSLLIFKTNGVYTIDSAGDDHQLYPDAVAGGTSEDGKYFFRFGNDVHVTYGKQHVRLVPTVSFGTPRLELQPIGPERFTQNDSVVRGRITAGEANGSLGAYAAIYNEDTGDSYLLKFGSWVDANLQEGKVDEATRIDAWHGSLTQKFSAAKITCMIRSSIGAPANHYRLYMGLSDGSLAWFTMPNTPNPAADTGYTFDNGTDATVDFPLFHAGHEADAKSLRGFTVAGTNLTTTEYCQWNYKLDPSAASYTAFGANFNTTPRQRVDFTFGVKSYLATLQLVLHNTNTTASPIITTPTVHYAIIPVSILIYSGVVLASYGLTKLNASPMRIGPSQIRTVVKAQIGAGGTTVTFPDESTKVVSFIDYGEQLAWDERANNWSAGLKFSCVEYITNSPAGGGSVITVYGTVLRLLPYLVSDLAGYSISDLGTL